LSKASKLVYVEDQYLWSHEVASVYARALRENPALLMVFVIPGYPEQDGRLSMPPNQVGRARALDKLRQAGGSRLAIYYLENDVGTPVYVHAKACIVDDSWACIGSDNTNRRSWTHDTELSAAFVDGHDDGVARSLRLELAAEHLAVGPTDPALIDPADFYEALSQAAKALDTWHADGRAGPRPPGHLRTFCEPAMSQRTKAWATPIYRVVYDPDGRSRRARRAGTY
jgi:phosphatidylserine/phosphatidylglycerophosphate/cardiolipin synthase-like enzyme